MNAVLSLALLVPGAPAGLPQPVVGAALSPGAVARLGPTAFRFAGVVGTLESGGSPVWFAPDGQRVGATTGTGLYLWDAATGERLLWVPTGDQTEVGFLGFHPNGQIIVQNRPRYDRAAVFCIDPTTGKVTAKFQPTDSRRFFTTSPDGKVVFSRAGDNDTTAENVANVIDTGKEIWRRKMPGMSWMRVSPDGSRLVVWSSRAQWEVEVLDAATGKTVERIAHPDSPTWTGGGVAVGPKAERIATAHGWNRGFTVFEKGAEQAVMRETGTWDDNIFFTADGKRAVVRRDVGRGEVRAEVWDLVARKKLSSVRADLRGSMALHPDGTTLADSGNWTHKTLRFFDVATGEPRPNTPEPFDRAAVVWYLPDGTLTSADQALTKPVKWDVKTGAMTALPAGTKPPAAPKIPDGFAPPAGTSNRVASPDGRRVIGYRFDPDELDSAPGDTYLGLFDARGTLVKRYLRPDQTNGASYAFSPDSKTFAVSRGDGALRFFDADTGAEIGSHRTAGGAGSLAFSPDGRHLALAGGDAPIVIWSVPDRKK